MSGTETGVKSRGGNTSDSASIHYEELIFEKGREGMSGVDFEAIPELDEDILSVHRRVGNFELPGLSEPEAVRHYVRLSRQNYAIDVGMFPLGSCTMKHNPRLNEVAARERGLGDLHPMQPTSSVQGALELMHHLSEWLVELTGMHSVAMSPKAGAHGEMCGMMAIKNAIRDRGEEDKRRVVLIPESAHGTNPATSRHSGYEIVTLPAEPDGTLSVEVVGAALSDKVAAIMLTNPNTCGLFEPGVREIADRLHSAGGYFYCDGANFNAILGKVRPGELGVDAMHINLHKTFSTPHGGGGPGAGPVVLSERLTPYAPVPFVRRRMQGDTPVFELVEDTRTAASSMGRMTAFHGQMGMFIRALCYMMSHGADGLRQISEDAVLNANYLRSSLSHVMSLPYDKWPSMHEVLFDDTFLRGTGVSTLDFAKALIDKGYHPMTIYFPLVVHGAMLVEPTESESLGSLNKFIADIEDLVQRLKDGKTSDFTNAPMTAPIARPDETQASRKPILKWQQPDASLDASLSDASLSDSSLSGS